MMIIIVRVNLGCTHNVTLEIPGWTYSFLLEVHGQVEAGEVDGLEALAEMALFTREDGFYFLGGAALM